jgi:hypothetical protein
LFEGNDQYFRVFTQNIMVALYAFVTLRTKVKKVKNQALTDGAKKDKFCEKY